MATHRIPRSWWRTLTARPAVLAVAAVAVLLLLLDTHWKVDPDSTRYLSMARSLAAGGPMLREGQHQWYYAPLYPVWIAPAFLTGSRPFLAISALNVLTAWAMVVGTYQWFGRYSRRGAGFAAALVGINVGLWDVCREPRSETLFSALLIWAAVFLARAADRPSRRRFGVDVAVGGVLLVAACLTRQVGMFLAVGFALTMLVRWWSGRCSAARAIMAGGMLLMAAAVTVGALVIHDRAARLSDRQPGADTYVDQYRQPDASLAGQLAEGFRRQTADVGRLLMPGMWGAFAHRGQWLNVTTIAYLLFTVPIVLGWWRLARRTGDPLLWTAPFYAAMFTVWPFDQGTRFNVPMLPVLWAAAWSALHRWPRRRGTVLAVGLALHLLVGVGYLIRDRAIVERGSRSWPPLIDLAARVDVAGPAAVLDGLKDDPQMFSYLLDRPVVTKLADGPGRPMWIVIGPPAVGRSGLATTRPRPVPDGFIQVAEAGGYRLCRRVR
jgi:hypothetical protein